MTSNKVLDQYILSQFGRSEGDDLERATMVFGRMTDKQLDEQWGQSGQTCRQIWNAYKVRRALHIEAYQRLLQVLGVN